MDNFERSVFQGEKWRDERPLPIRNHKKHRRGEKKNEHFVQFPLLAMQFETSSCLHIERKVLAEKKDQKILNKNKGKSCLVLGNGNLFMTDGACGCEKMKMTVNRKMIWLTNNKGKIYGINKTSGPI